MAQTESRNWLSLFIKGTLFLILFLFVIVALLHHPDVQRHITKVAVDRIINSTQGDLRFESCTFDLNKGVNMKSITLLDVDVDTLLTVRELSISPRRTLVSLISEVSFSDLNIVGTQLKVIRRHGEEKNNWVRFTSGFSISKNAAEKESRLFPLSHVELYDLSIDYHDEVDCTFLTGILTGFEIKINQISEDLVDIDFINLIEPNLKYSNSQNSTAHRDSTLESSQSSTLPKVLISQLNLIDGDFDLVGSEKYDAKNIDFVLSEIELTSLEDWSTVIDDISLSTDDLDLKHLSVSKVESSPDQVDIDNLFLRVNSSYIKADVQAVSPYNISALEDVVFILDVGESKIRPYDFIQLTGGQVSDKVMSEPLIKKRHQLTGEVNLDKGDLRVSDLKLWLNGSHYLHANGTIDKINDIDNSLLNLQIVQLQSDLNKLDRDINLITIPEDLKRLGSLNFDGTFDGFINDFVAQGKLKSELGEANMDIQFDLYRSDPELIRYGGYLNLIDFDLAEMLQQEDFGPISLSVDINSGEGTSFANSSAEIEAIINQFWYRKVQYESAIYCGNLSSKVIDGEFFIDDANLDFQFSGLIDFSDTEPIFDFDLKAEKIDFCQLNLTDFPCSLKFEAQVDFFGKSASTLQGNGIIKDIVINHDTSELLINRIDLSSRRLSGDQMSFKLDADFMELMVRGKFNLTKLHENLVCQIFKNHDSHLGQFGLKNPYEGLRDEQYSVQIETKNVNPIFAFLNLDLEIDSSTTITAESNSSIDKSVVTVNSGRIQYKDVISEDIYVNIDSRKDYGEIELLIDHLIQGDREVDKVSWVAHLRQNDLYAKALINIDIKNHVELETKSQIVDDGYYTQFLYDDILLDSSLWTILPNKGIGIYNRSIDIENFIVTDGFRALGIKDIFKRGLELSLREFDFEVINPIIDYDKLYFSGTVNAQIKLNNIFEKLAIEGFFNVPDFTINQADYGSLKIESTRKEGNILDLSLSIEKDGQNLYVNGTADIDNKSLNTYLVMQQYPLAFLEYIIDDGISETSGLTDIELDIYGTFDDIKMRGEGRAQDAGTKIDYIGAYYQLSDDVIPITERFIDLSNITLTDEAGNTAQITGGLRHNVLADFSSDLVINSNRFIALNTTELDNPIYYGLGMGPIDVSFKGPFDRIDMIVDAVAGPNSLLYIPITSTEYGYDESFINFNLNKEVVDSNTIELLVERLKSSGLDFEMNLSFDRDAEVQIIYDEESSNVLIGHGVGDLQVKVKRDGEFTVYGQYDVDNGEYLYTSYGFIAKPFIIEQGGTVTWTGDPINAVLDVRAYYPSLRAPLNRFLQEYEGVYPDVTESDLRQRRNIDLDLILTGNLFNPDIDFDLGFPDLVGNLRNLADSKVRTLAATENGINNQVLGLIVFNNFLPDNDPLANIQVSSVAQLGGNTITEFLTSQLSLMATEYLSELLEGDFITGIDLDIALAQNNAIGDANIPNPDASFIEFIPDEYQLNLRNEFKNDNFVLKLGGNYVRENPFNTVNDYLTGDFSLDWFITHDKRLKLQIYGVYDLDEATLGRRQKYGFGINYTREFGKMTYGDIQDALNDLSTDIQSGERSNSGSR